MQSHRLAIMLHESAVRLCKASYPTEDELERLAGRITENFAIIPLEWQRAIAGVFAPLDDVPDCLIETFINAQESVAGPFIAASPAISDAILIALVEQHGASGHTRAIARRKHLSETVKGALRDLAHPAIDRALELRQVKQTPVQQALPSDVTLSTATPATGENAQVTELLDIENRALFETALADRTGLSMTSARILCDDPTSKNLLFALRFMGLETAQAEQIFGILAGDLKHDQEVQARFRGAYDAIDREDAAERVRSWQLEEIRSLTVQRPNNLAAPSKKSSNAA